MTDKKEQITTIISVDGQQELSAENHLNSQKQLHAPQQSEAATIMAVIERMAVMPDINMDNIERMMRMYEDGLNRQAKMEFASDMAKLQAEMPIISEKGQIMHNNRLISKYAKFEDMNEEIKPPMTKYGFSVSFRSNFKDDYIFITGILTHKMGHSEETTMKLPFDSSGSKNNVQAIGSSVSYGKRYVLCMLLNISTGGDDDDGNSQRPQSAACQFLTNAQIRTLRRKIKDAGVTEKWFCQEAQIPCIEDLQQGRLKGCNGVLDALIDKRGSQR